MKTFQENEDLIALKKERERAIEKCEFDRVQAIDLTIQHLKEEMAIKTSHSQQVQALLEYETKREQVKHQIIQLQSQYQNLLFEKSVQFQEKIIALNDEYQKLNVKYAEQYAKDLEVCTIRDNPRVNELIKLAQTNARNKNYEAAQQIYAEAEELKESISSKNRDELTTSYDKLHMYNENRYYKTKMEILLEKKATSLKEVEKEFALELSAIRKSLEKYATKLQLPRQDESALFDNLSLTNPDEIELNQPPNLLSHKTQTPKSSKSSIHTPLSKTKTSSRTPSKTFTPSQARKTPGRTTPKRQTPRKSPSKSVSSQPI